MSDTSSNASPAVRAAVHAAGSDAPERPTLRVGFLPLVDAAPLVLASVLGTDVAHGVRFVLSREASWAALRDKLLAGALDLAQMPYGMVYGVHTGIGGLRREMAVLMGLNRNGQGISLARRWADKGVVDGTTLGAFVRRDDRRLTLAHTFPTATHAMWLAYWLAAHGIHPLRDVATLVAPPSQMVELAAAGQIDGFSVGAPWNQAGIVRGVSVHAAASQDIWPDHPEKALASTAAFADANPNAARAAIRAVLDAARWIETGETHLRAAAAIVAGEAYVDTPVELIAGRLLGRYEDGRGRRWLDAHPMRFFDEGAATFPWLSDGVWFMTQHKRWGLLAEHPDYEAVARRVQRLDLYREAAAAAGVALPAGDRRASRLVDGVVWDGRDPAGYADGFAVGAVGPASPASTRPGPDLQRAAPGGAEKPRPSSSRPTSRSTP